MEFLKIVALSVVAAIAYGIAQDQVTARVCIEYFTIGHPRIFQTHSPTLLALGWGVIGTWWLGLILGVPLAIVSRAGKRPRLSAKQLIFPILILLGAMGIISLLAGIVGYFLAENGQVWMTGNLAALVPKDRHALFLTDLWAHCAAYAAGFLGGIVLCIYIWMKRKRKEQDKKS